MTVEWHKQVSAVLDYFELESAFEFLQRIKQFLTTDISASIRQDVPLMAGCEDHYVPVKQLQHQTGMLKNARSTPRACLPGVRARRTTAKWATTAWP
jgi:hypothetical protein